MTGLAFIPALCATTDGPLFAASVEGAIILLVLWLLSALFNWIKRRAEEKQSGAPAPVPPRPGEHPAPAPAPATAAKTWEEELKRLLEGESPVFTPAPPPPVAPPIIVTVPPPVLAPARAPARAPATRRTAAVEPWSEESDAPSRPLATLRESEAAFSSASQLHERVAARMRHVVDHTREVSSSPLEIRRHHVAATATLALLQSPQSARQAIVTALVLAPPKALEN